MSYQGFILSSRQLTRDNSTYLEFQGRLSDNRRFHWTVTRPRIVFFIAHEEKWTPPNAYRRQLDLYGMRGEKIDALYYHTYQDMINARENVKQKRFQHMKPTLGRQRVF